MPAENNVKKLGRVEYIEPNSLFVHSPGDKVQNGIPQPYEDYSFSVNLRVINGNRYDCGMTSDGDDIANKVLEFSSDRGTISFMDGTSIPGQQGYLTTNFTDISMNNPETNTRECLGIESISIKYDSWYYPMVTIKFIDVRGASLMQPAEYEYYNNGGPNLGKNNATSNSDFFKAFFSFPYPLFKLSVKGFYGKEVTYDLSVLKCSIDFNSSTGNFEVNANFIGYMYGMYSDLPFPFVYIAPYINLYGSTTWSEKKGTGDFCYLTTDSENPVGRPMYTFPELKRKVKNAAEIAKKEIEEEPSGKKKNGLMKLIDKLEHKVLANFPSKSTHYTWWSWSKTNTEDNRSGFFYIMLNNTPEANRNVFEDFLKFETYLREYNELATGSTGVTEGMSADDTKYFNAAAFNTKPIFEGVYLDAEEIKKNKKQSQNEVSAATISSDYTDDDIKKMLDGRVVSLCFKKDSTDEKNPVLNFDASSSDFGTKSSRAEYDELINEIIDRFKNDDIKAPIQKRDAQKEWTIRAFKLDNIQYINTFVNTLNDLKRELNKMLKIIEKLREEKIDSLIGFIPSMRNMYNMVFAHIDTFMTCFYNTLDRIRKSIQSNTDGTRKYETLCGGDIKVDVNKNTLASKSANGGKLPPFTMFYKEETEKDSEDRKITMIWPGSLKGGNELDEVKLVEAIIDATSLKRRPDEAVTPKDNTIGKEGNLVPTNYYDIMHGSWNPYLDILNEKTLSNESIVKEVVKVFILRCYYSMLSGSYVAPDDGNGTNGSSTSVENYTKKANLIAELEVGNVVRAFESIGMNPSENFINQLLRTSNDGSSIISGYLSGDKPMFSSNGTNGNLEYKWIKKSNFYCLPVGVFTPSVLENYLNGANLGNDYDKFVKINDSGTLTSSFCCQVYHTGGKIRQAISKYGSGDFKNAAKLFPNYKTKPKTIENVIPGGESSGTYPAIPSYRKTEAGITSVFMDPLYYAQSSPEARAYLFLMGIPFDKEKNFFLPEKIENGDYPTLLLLREGAVYWRNDFIIDAYDEGAPLTEIIGDPITYKYTINGVEQNVLADIEKNDPSFGVKRAVEFYNTAPKNTSEGRRQTLINYFLKWVTGVDAGKRPDAVTANAYSKIEVPPVTVDFQTIENNLGLFEVQENSEAKQLLTPSSCVSAITAEFASSFANAGRLKSIYEVGPDDKLGKLNQKIRTDVRIRKKAEDNATIDIIAFLGLFGKLYTGNDTIIDFSCLDNPNSTTTVPRSAMNDAVSAFVKGLKDAYDVSAKKLKEATGVNSEGKQEDKSEEVRYYENDSLKLACYMALKNIYDRWLCSRRRESWYFSCKPDRIVSNGVKSDFTRFFYIDEFYHNIGMQIRPNLTDFTEMTCSEGGFTEQTDESSLAACSIMKILSNTAEEGGCALLTLPTMLGLAKTYTGEGNAQNSIAEVFKAYPYNDAVRSNSVETSFIVLYSNQKSSVLDIEDDKGEIGYTTDGFDIANTWGEIIPQPMFNDGGEDGFVVPCFGVTFAKQNQSYFKDIRLSMEDHQVTDFSIRNEIMISYQNNQGPRETTVLGQDLYAVYSNYSYSCNVGMMGDAQITPLMYFQLNNIAMWKGAYLITNVHHDITAHGMETTFTGVRQARPSVPFKNDNLDIPSADMQQKVPPAKNQEPNNTPDGPDNTPLRPLDKINVEDVKSIIFILDRTSLMTSGKWINGLFSVRVYYNDDRREDYQDIALTIEATRGLKGQIENFTPEQNEVYFSIPKGRYAKVFIENAPVGQEYRDPNDTFYKFTDGKHITVNDMRLGTKSCEIITGETDYKLFESGGFKDVSFGGASPIMLFANDSTDINKQFDRDEIRATYREIFSLVKRMNEAKKPLSFLVNESKTINYDKIQEEVIDE